MAQKVESWRSDVGNAFDDALGAWRDDLRMWLVKNTRLDTNTAKLTAEDITADAMRFVEFTTIIGAITECELPHPATAPAADPAPLRPANCRFRLKDEGKPYPRSGCSGCNGDVFAIGNECRYADIVR